MTHRFDPSILRAYDIRGVVGETLDEEDAHAVGAAFAAEVLGRAGRARVVVGRDGRPASPGLEAALVRGLVAAGGEAVRVGVGPTPMAHFAGETLGADAVAVVTGSHNPPAHNGFKLAVGGAPFHGDDIAGLARRAAEGAEARPGGKEGRAEVRGDYVRRLRAELPGKGSALRAAWDAGHGAAAAVLGRLAALLPGDHVLLNAEVDGTFPAHHPDPSVPANMEQLADAVRGEGLDVGFAFDGDGDRLGVVDGRGRIVPADHLLCLFAADVLETSPGAAVLSDVKASDVVFRRVEELGGRAVMGPTGHSHMRAGILAGEAVFAGEVSGHLFFADRYYGFDDALYAAVRLLGALGRGAPLAERCDSLPRLAGTPELRIPCPDARKFALVEEVRAGLADEGAEVQAVDGVRVRTGGGWWLLRASNTEPAVVVRCEARDGPALDSLRRAVRKRLAAAGVEPAGL